MKYPFVANTDDDTHCLQAALKMVLGYHLPNEQYTLEELDSITGHDPELWTYPYRMYTWLTTRGFTVQHIEDFDVMRFAQEGEAFLQEYWDPEVYALQKEYSDFTQAQHDAQAALTTGSVTFDDSSGTLRVARDHFNQGASVLVRVNPYTLRNEDGNGSHVVVIVAISDNTITLHDPGLPPQEGLEISHGHMQRAMFGDDSLVLAIKN